MNPAQMRLFSAAAAVLASNCWSDPTAEWSANKDKTLDFCALESSQRAPSKPREPPPPPLMRRGGK